MVKLKKRVLFFLSKNKKFCLKMVGKFFFLSFTSFLRSFATFY